MSRVNWQCPGCNKTYSVPDATGLIWCPTCQSNMAAAGSAKKIGGKTNHAHKAIFSQFARLCFAMTPILWMFSIICLGAPDISTLLAAFANLPVVIAIGISIATLIQRTDRTQFQKLLASIGGVFASVWLMIIPLVVIGTFLKARPDGYGRSDFTQEQAIVYSVGRSLTATVVLGLMFGFCVAVLALMKFVVTPKS